MQAKELLCVLADLAMQNDLDFLLFCVLIASGCVISKKGKKNITFCIAFRSVALQAMCFAYKLLHFEGKVSLGQHATGIPTFNTRS